MQLIANAKQWYKMTSVWFSGLAATIITLSTAFPDAALQAYLMLPQEFKQFIPQTTLRYIVVVIILLSIFARLVKQPKLKVDENPIKGTLLAVFAVMGVTLYWTFLYVGARGLA